MKSLVEVIAQHSINCPHKIAVVADDSKITYREFWEKIQDLCLHLKTLGVSRGDCVLLHAIHKTSFLVSVFGIHLAGGIFVPIDKQAPIENVKEIIKSTGAKIFISSKQFDIECKTVDLDEILNYKYDIYENEITYPDIEDSADLFFTTGTTGKAKGVEYTHKTLISVAENLISGVHPERNTVYLVYGPLNHVFSIRKIYYMLFNSSTVVLLDGLLNVKKFFTFIEKYKINALHILPSAARILFKLTGNKLGDYSNQIRIVESGTSPLSETDKERLCDLLPKTRLYFGYGCSESDSLSKLEFSKYRGYENCVGKLTVNSIVNIVDEDRNVIKSSKNNPGFIASKGPMNMKGYWKDPALTFDIMPDGYVYTNDIGYFDENGFLYILGRSGDVINVGGIKVSSNEIENFSLQHKHITDCACIPINDEISGQVPKLFVVMDSEENFSQLKIKEFLSKNLETYKLPRIIESIKEIPRSFNGKILKNKLK